MGLDAGQEIPMGMSRDEAYTAIRQWYQNNIPLLQQRMSDRGKISEELIRSLPTADHLSDPEATAVFREVLCGHLEWAFHETDGTFKMAAYARAGLGQHGLSLSDEEVEALRTSALWPYLFHVT